MRNIIIRSSLRNYFCHPETGANIGLTRYGNHVITKFDLVEFRQAWGDPAPEQIDIIDIGYWYLPLGAGPEIEPSYEPPVWHQREDAA